MVNCFTIHTAPVKKKLNQKCFYIRELELQLLCYARKILKLILLKYTTYFNDKLLENFKLNLDSVACCWKPDKDMNIEFCEWNKLD